MTALSLWFEPPFAIVAWCLGIIAVAAAIGGAALLFPFSGDVP